MMSVSHVGRISPVAAAAIAAAGGLQLVFRCMCADGHYESDFGRTDLKWYIRDPNSVASTVWDVIQVPVNLH